MMNPDEADRELSRLYRKAEPVESPAALDRRILETAENLAPEPRPRYRHHWKPALAATVVVGLALTLAIPVGDDPGIAPVAPPFPAAELAEEGAGFKDSRQEADVDLLEDTGDEAPGELRAVRKRAPADADAPPPTSLDSAMSKQEPAPQRMDAKPRSASSKTSMEMREALAPPTANSDARVQTGAPARDPDTWLGDIEKLLEAGQGEAARREYALFRERYPDVEVGDDLLQRLALAGELD